MLNYTLKLLLNNEAFLALLCAHDCISVCNWISIENTCNFSFN